MGPVGSQRLREPRLTGPPDRSAVTSFSFDSCQLEEVAAAVTGAAHDQGAPIFSDSAEEPVPDDRYHAIYFAMLLAGVGFLLPYNSFITDVDYLHHKFPGTSIVFDMSLTYILVALVAVLLNNALVERLSLHSRITAGYLLALGPLLFISVCDVWLQLFSREQAYAINLAAVGTVAFGCTVQQSSFYGYTGMLPKRYTQGVMTGESTAGVMVSLSRILTKLLLPDELASTLIFFLVSAGLELLCFLLHLLVRRSRFVLHHTVRPRAGYRVHHDVAAGGVCFENQGSALADSGSPRDSPAHEVVISSRGAYVRFDAPRPRAPWSWSSFRALLRHRYAVARVIWADMLSIAVTYFITLCLFPGLESEIRHCVLGEWLPILAMAVFNLSDFVGKRDTCPSPPGLALYFLPARGHQQWLLRQCAHDPGSRQRGPHAARAGGEHHDRVLHDGADARLRRGLLHLQPHPRRPRQLLLRPHHQRLFPCRPVSQPCPERPLGPTPGPEA
ncbi:equilibrative nucleoside transporter 4 isoform X3 [Rousettus aegyptiacus]|uniref:equilibrative nucleoside transporter 4 isoform X3 n=1 Tax=Rousettus aegyptiacus TaxID=9407 RepID=UPI00168D45B2|nr:equilibrative nucleoside transporter 4 isoform X3 [Rousettus aegyptiacus]